MKRKNNKNTAALILLASLGCTSMPVRAVVTEYQSPDTSTNQSVGCEVYYDTHYDFTIVIPKDKPDDKQGVTVGSYVGVYDGNFHGIIVACETYGAVISYSTDGGKTYTSERPLYKDVGTYTTYFKVEKDGEVIADHHASVKIEEAEIEYSSSDYSGLYDGKTHSINLAVYTEGCEILYSKDGITYSSEKPEYKETGIYTTYYRVTKDNYKVIEGSRRVIIGGHIIDYTVDDWTGKYDGKPHGITIDISIEGCEVLYSMDGIHYTSERPTYTEAGSYVTYFKIIREGYETVEGNSRVIIEEINVNLSDNSGTVKVGDSIDFTVDTDGEPFDVTVADPGIVKVTVKDGVIIVTGLKEALDWAIQYGFVTTTGGSGKYLRIIYQDNSGGYGKGAASTYTGSCDGYIKTTIGDIYEAMKLYRQVVWKTTNMRMIPSFAEYEPGNCETIKLYWDEEQHLYTATVSDQNAVLNYFDFTVPGCEVTNNGDGTLTISTPNQIGTVTSPASQSKLEPVDGVFKLPDYFRWDKEGTNVTFQYTAFVGDYDGNGSFWVEDGNNRAPGGGEHSVKYNHSHSYAPACNWFCSDWQLEQYTEKDCTRELNSGWKNNSCDCDLEEGEECSTNHGGHNTTHEHTEECKHKNSCPYYKNKGGKQYWNGQPSSDCYVVWCCGKEHFNRETRTVSGQYIKWQPTSGVYARGQKLIDPEKCYIRVETVPHEFPAETDTEILLIADNDEWNDLTYTAPNGKVIKHSSHLRVGEKFHLKYIYSYKGASKGFRIEFSLENKPYYQYNYLARMQEPDNTKPIYQLRTGLAGDRFSQSSINVPHAKLVQDLTDIKIRGLYATPETAYTLNGAYSWSSGTSWNDSIYLDALVTDQFDDNYDNGVSQ